MAELREIVSGLQFPEGPIAMDDVSVVLVWRKTKCPPRMPRPGPPPWSTASASRVSAGQIQASIV